MSPPDRQENTTDQTRLLALSADVGRALTTGRTLADMLRDCTQALVAHLDAAFARVWVLDAAADVLVLRASAGRYTHLDGPHGRVPVGQFKIGLIAQERVPHLTNAVIGDPRISDQEWAEREGMVAFAGHPLIVEDRLVGVVALFARRPLSGGTLRAIGSVADQIAVGIDRVRTEAALRESGERLRAALTASGMGTFRWDIRTNTEDWDENLDRLFELPPGETARTREEFLAMVHPEDRAEIVARSRRCAEEGADFDMAFRTVWPDGSVHWLDDKGKTFLDAEGRPAYMTGAIVDITAQRLAAEALRRQAERERFLAELAERARTLTDPDAVIADAVRSVGSFLGVSRCIFADIDIEADTCAVRPDYRADDTVASIEGIVPISAFGPYVVAEYAARRPVAVDDVRADPVKAPPETIAAYEAIGILAHVTVPVVHSGRVVSCLSVHNAMPRHWEPEEVALLQTVVERTWLTVEVTRQQNALVREAEERREAHERTTDVLQSISDGFITLDHEWRFTYLNDQAERVLFQKRDEMLGRLFWDVFPETVGTTFEYHYRRAVDEGVTVSFEEFFPPLDAWFEVRVYPSNGGLSLFFQNVNARKMAEAERERLLAEQHTRAEREALLNRISQALRDSAEPGQVLGTAVRELGQALRADRCYYAAYDQEADTATVGPDWHTDDLPPLAGRYTMSLFAVNRDPIYQRGNTQAVADTAADAATRALGLCALVRVPLVSGTAMTALSVAMTSGPRDWTPEEVSLVEAVATQTQSALEAVRVQRREHNIAEQLQAALQPPLPGGVTGLKLAKYYEAALEEAGVGGDFYDAFALDKGRTVLAVGDLSGKGLRAAAEVSTVRNMLRAFLYSKPTLAEAVTDLNRVLALNGLLSGFATLWVGCYDGSTGELTYVNMGQEPALLRRAATGEIEQLAPTGPVLGAAENACYEERVVPLSPGDALAVFSDGATECGVSRREMVGIEGVMALLSPPLAREEAEDALGMAEALTRRIVEGIDAASHGGLAKDDVCILVAVAEGGPAGPRRP